MGFKVFDDDKEINCDIICTFKDVSNKTNYIIYTDGTTDENGDLIMYASKYKSKDKTLFLEDLSNDYECNLVDNMLNSYANGSEVV